MANPDFFGGRFFGGDFFGSHLRISSFIGSSAGTGNPLDCGTNYVVKIPKTGVIYVFILGSTGISSVLLRKSSDNGLSWADPIAIFAFSTTIKGFSVWYDGWSGLSTGLIHIVYTHAGSTNLSYRNLDTLNGDVVSPERTVFIGASGTPAVTVTKARGGNLIAAGSGGAWKSTDAGISWLPLASPGEGDTSDRLRLLPGWNADNQDVMVIFHDASADELSVKRYDDSSDSWTETSIVTDIPESLVINYIVSAAVDSANSQNVVIAWDIVSSVVNLSCWTINDTAITAKTSAVVDPGKSFSACSIGVDTTQSGRWCACYGLSNEEIPLNMDLYASITSDAGSTWTTPLLISNARFRFLASWMTPQFEGDDGYAVFTSPTGSGATLLPQMVSTKKAVSKPALQIGL